MYNITFLAATTSQPTSIAIAAIVATILGTLATYLIGWRKNSGKIDTSDAATLWAESQAMRKELRDEVTTLREQLAIALNNAVELQKKILILQAKLRALGEKV